jgi:DNA-binding GntR family transcriptional regulator
MSTLGHRAYVELRRRLAEGEFPPGSQLVNRTISAQVGMSMTPVREAIARLASEGIVHYIPGAGSYVRSVTRQELAQLYDLREVLEPFAASLAAEQITLNEWQELRDLCKDWRSIVAELKSTVAVHATKRQMSRWNSNERRFHELIMQASRNTWLIKIVDDLQLMAFSFNPQRGLAEFLTPVKAESTYRDHLRMLKALRQRDATGIRRLTKRHIRVGRIQVLEFLEKQSAVQNSVEPPAS